MVRQKTSESPGRRARRVQAQSWTRCRIPVDQPVPYDLGGKGTLPATENEWQEKLSFLTEFPGYVSSRCGRDINDRENVLFVITWKDEDIIQSFIASSAYAVYLKTFFGMPSAPSPSAFFTLRPRRVDFKSEKLTIFTLSYAQPVAPEAREMRADKGLEMSFHKTRVGRHNQCVWVREPRLGEDGRAVESGMVVQQWPDDYDFDIQAIVSKDLQARERWEREVARTNPVAMEEVTWLWETPKYPEDETAFLDENYNKEDGEEQKKGRGDDGDDVVSKQLKAMSFPTS